MDESSHSSNSELGIPRNARILGSGLGKDGSGAPDAIKVKIKHDKTGVGHDPGKEFTNNWWNDVFNKAADALQVHTTDEGIVLKTEKLNKKEKKRKAKETLYGRFTKGATLTDSREVHCNESESSSDSEPETNLFGRSEDEIFRRCGGRTAHKGARHGMKLSGKLSRIEEQERLYFENIKEKSTCPSNQNQADVVDSEVRPEDVENKKSHNVCKKKRKKNKDRDADLEPNDSNAESSNSTTCTKKLKKKKKKHKRQHSVNVLNGDNCDGQGEPDCETKRKKKRRSNSSVSINGDE